MKTPSIDELRKKYYDGDASLEEEKLLKQLLQAPDAPSEWKEEGELMDLMSMPIEVVPPTGFERRIMERLEREYRKSSAAPHSFPLRSLRPWLYASTVAASLVASIFIIEYSVEPEYTVYTDTCQNAEAAKAEIEDALILVAKTLTFHDIEEDIGGPCE